MASDSAADETAVSRPALGDEPPPLAVRRTRVRKTSRLAVQDATGKRSADDVSDIVFVQSLWRRRVARRRFKATIKRTYIVQELFSTEKAYVDSLRYVVEKYEKPLFERAAKGAALVPEKDLKALFFQIQPILVNNIKLLEHLEARLKHWSAWQLIGDVFVEMSPTFESYTAFVNNYELAHATLRKHERSNAAFAQFVTEMEQASTQRLKLSDFLIMPVQRIPRYELLLSQILAQTTADHPDFANLKAGVIEIKRVADFINEKKRQAEARAKVAEIESKMSGDFPPLTSDTRLFVRDGDIVASLDGGREMRRLFLFNDALLCVSKFNPSGNSHIVSKVMSNAKFEFEYDWMVPLLNLSGLHAIEKPVKEGGYVEPNEIMKEIARLEKQLDIERHIERSAAKIAQIYKMENNRATKNEAKREVGETESNMELIAKELKQQRDRMRLYEPVVGLAIITDDNHSFTFVVRSTSQRDEWIRDITHWRKTELNRIGEDEVSHAKKKKSASVWSLKGLLDASVSSLSTLSKSVGQQINKKVMEGAQAVSHLASGSSLYRNTTVNATVTDRRRLLRGPSRSKSTISRGGSANNLAAEAGSDPAPAAAAAAAATGPPLKGKTAPAPAKTTAAVAPSPSAADASGKTVKGCVSVRISTSQEDFVPVPQQAKPARDVDASSVQSHKENSQPDKMEPLRDSDSAPPPMLARSGSLMAATKLPASPIVEFNPMIDAPRLQEVDAAAEADEADEKDRAEKSHNFETKVFARSVRCDVCSASIAPHGREGMKCSECSFRCHRKCLKSVAVMCTHTRDPLMDQLDDAPEVNEDYLITPGVFADELIADEPGAVP